MQEFWAEFGEEKVDLKRIMLIASKIFPFKARIEEISNDHLKGEKFASFQILNLYLLYLRMILNQD
jgi:hypothetical protein